MGRKFHLVLNVALDREIGSATRLKAAAHVG